MALRRLILLRHGETDWNRVMRMQGHIDVPLNEAGLAQVRAVAPAMADLAPDVVVASDLARTMVTAQMIAAELDLPVRPDRRLRETDYGQWEGLHREDIRAGWSEDWVEWRRRGSTVRPPGGESRPDVAARAAEVVAELDAESHTSALLVTHGGVILALTPALLGLPTETWGLTVGVGNCRWVLLRRIEQEWRLEAYNIGVSPAGGGSRPSTRN